MNPEHSARHAAAARDAGLGRLRRLTGLTVGAAIVLSGAFAGIAARSTSGHKAVRQRTRATSNKATAPALPPPRAPSAAGPSAPAAPPAPAPAPAAPVAVSGGS